jgi:murein DD-endopeptidase MepM/ murein hydrolase activator NlpD
MAILEQKEEGEKMVHHDYVTPKFTSDDKALLKRFLDEHDNFKEFHYRKGAAYTCNFGIAEGYGPNMVEGYVRIHQGVDRAGGGTVGRISDIVMSPMHFDSSGFVDFKGKSYGSLVFLSSKKYAFDMRVAHMHPENDIIPWSLQQFKNHNPFQQNWLVGSAGTYGYSTGAHTHTELMSHDESCEVFELMLMDKFGDAIFKEYNDEEVVSFYREQARRFPRTSPYNGWSDGQILNDWTNMKRRKGVFFVNKYRCCFFWNNRAFTRYATNEVLKGL